MTKENKDLILNYLSYKGRIFDWILIGLIILSMCIGVIGFFVIIWFGLWLGFKWILTGLLGFVMFYYILKLYRHAIHVVAEKYISGTYHVNEILEKIQKDKKYRKFTNNDHTEVA